MRVLAFRHAPLEGIGLIAGSLARKGILCEAVDLYADPSAAIPLATADGLIVMGGSISVNDNLPWLRREEETIRAASARGIPVLGICLGAQLIAKALGARVEANPSKEIGWFPVSFTAAAHDDGLFRGFAGPETLFHWHGETFQLPHGAELLANSEACARQAFRAAANIYGIQFHLEVTPAMIEEWLRQDEACGDAREVCAQIDSAAHATRASAVASIVFDRWCSLLR